MSSMIKICQYPFEKPNSRKEDNIITIYGYLNGDKIIPMLILSCDLFVEF
jgi:hypothetical protein